MLLSTSPGNLFICTVYLDTIVIDELRLKHKFWLYLPEITQPSTSMSDPRKQPTPPAVATRPATSTPPTAESAQAALLALLSSATATGNAQPSHSHQDIPRLYSAACSIFSYGFLRGQQHGLSQPLSRRGTRSYSVLGLGDYALRWPL